MRLHAALRKLLPAWFRRRHGDAMAAVFDAQMDDARRRGRFAVLSLWSREVLDLVRASATIRWSLRPRVEIPADRVAEARVGRVEWLRDLPRDVVQAGRSFRKHPGFTAVAVLSLALGIGANLAVFHVMDRLILTKLPVEDPDGLYNVVVMQANGRHDRNPYPKFEVMRDSLRIFDPIFGWGDNWPRQVVVGDWVQQAQVVAVTGNYFEALGVRPFLGRLLSSRDEQELVTDVAVISHRLWRTAFASDPDVVGRVVRVEGRPEEVSPQNQDFFVVGVGPPEFDGTEPGLTADVYLPVHGYDLMFPGLLAAPGSNWFHIMGRLASDVPLESARAVARERWAELDEPNRLRFSRNTHDHLLLEDGSRGYSDVRRQFSSGVLALMGLVAAVFLIACANVATLLFVRGAGRTREMSIRTAIGASRGQLVRQWMTECMLMALLGGAAGLWTARSITDVLLRFVSEDDRPWLRFEDSPTIVGVSIVLTLAAGLLSGLLPGIRATGSRIESMLRAHSSTATGRIGRLSEGVLALQLAVSLILVVGGALFARTLWNLNATTGGFARREVVYADPAFFNSSISGPARRATVDTVIERLRQSPLVAAVGMGDPPMLYGNSGWGYITEVPGYDLGDNEDNTAYANDVFPGYFDALGVTLLAGRDFEERDRPARPNDPPTRIIINRHMARHYFGERDAVGQRLTRSGGFEVEIIGVVEDVQMKSLRDGSKDVYYQAPGANRWGTLVVRAAPGVDAAVLEASVRTAFAEVAPDLPVNVQRLEEAVQRSLGQDRLVAQLAAVFGLLAVILAAMGLYAAVAHSVAAGTREIGIHVVMGATATDVVWGVLKRGVGVTGAGVLIGLPVAMVGSRLVQSLLFDVSPFDPLVFGGAAGVLVVTALVAAWVPARRAARLDPSRTLRFE